jgi:hypothetical protein
MDDLLQRGQEPLSDGLPAQPSVGVLDLATPAAGRAASGGRNYPLSPAMLVSVLEDPFASGSRSADCVAPMRALAPFVQVLFAGVCPGDRQS